MSVMYCTVCDQYVDTDWNVEHFNEDGNCIDEHAKSRIVLSGNFELDTANQDTACDGFRCPHITPMRTDGVMELDSLGEPWFWYCSWNCVVKQEKFSQQQAERNIDKRKEDLRTARMAKRTDPMTGRDIY